MKRILVVDDVAESRYRLEATLQAYGYEVISTHDGAEALACARRQPPDLVISDIPMRMMDGFEFCRQWHEEDPLRGIPFIFYTATHTDARDEQLAMDLGADRFVVQPQEPQVMHAIIQEVMVRHLEMKLSELEPTREALEEDFRQRYQVEAALWLSEERWRLIFETEPECVKIVSSEGTLMDMNPAGLAMIGARSPDEVCGTSLLDLIVPEHRDAYLAMHRDVIGGQSRRIVFEAIGLKGARLWLETNAVPLWNADGTVSQLGITRDITERKRAEEALVEGERRFRKLFESSRDAIFVEDSAGHVLDVNPAACRLHGLTREQLLSMNVRDLVPPEQLATVARDFPKLLDGELMQTEGFSLRADGTVVPVELSVSRIVYDGQPSLLLHVRDITERKQTEALVNGQRQVLELIASGVPLAESLTALLRVVELQSSDMFCSILLLDADGIHLTHGAAPSLPPEYCRAIDGIAIGPCVGSCGTAEYRCETVIVADIAADPLWTDYRDLALRHGLRACWSTPIFDAQRRVLGTFAMYYRQPARPSERQLRLIEMATHTATIAIVKHREEAVLRASEERYRLLADHADDFVGLNDTEGRQLYLSPSYYRVTGWTAEEVQSTDWRTRMHPDDLPMIERAREANLAGEATTIEHRVRCRDGRWIWTEARCRPILDANGRVQHLLLWSRDITERRRAQDALLASEERYRLLFERNLAGVFQSTLAGQILDCNDAFVRMFGYDSKDELLRCRAADLYPRQENRTDYLQVLLAKRALTDYELQLKRKDGKLIWGNENVGLVPLGKNGEDIIQGTIVETTARRLAEEEVRQSRERLAALSRQLITAQEQERRHLARELHDEIGQVLTAVSVNLEALKGLVPPEAAARLDDSTAIVDEAIRQVRNLSLDLRPTILDDLGLEAALRWFVDRLAQRTGLQVRFTSRLPGRLPDVLETTCFRVIQEALNNVVRHGQARQVDVELRGDAEELRLHVHDDGRGFDVREARQRAAVGQCSGLSSMQERTELAGGELTIVSAAGQGTDVACRFPMPDEDEP